MFHSPIQTPTLVIKSAHLIAHSLTHKIHSTTLNLLTTCSSTAAAVKLLCAVSSDDLKWSFMASHVLFPCEIRGVFVSLGVNFQWE